MISNNEYLSKLAEKKAIVTGRKTEEKHSEYASYFGYCRRDNDLSADSILQNLRSKNTSIEKIKYLKQVSPEMGMAIWSFQRLSNQGGNIEFYNLNGGLNQELIDEWRGFAERIGQANNLGLDGLIDQLHYSYFVMGAMAVEVEVSKDRRYIEDVHVVSPENIFFKNEKIDGRVVHVPYQRTQDGEVCLREDRANFYWIPHDPDPDKSEGTLALETSIYPIDYQLEIQKSIAQVLLHQGFPKYDIVIDKTAIMNSLSDDIRADKARAEREIDRQIRAIASGLKGLEPNSDFIHTNDFSIGIVGAADKARSVDTRAINEMLGEMITNGSKTMGTFINKASGKTETWATVEFSLMVNYIKSCQKASKRMVENVARMWLRVKGVQAKVRFTHKNIDYKSDIQKEELIAKRLENARTYMELGFMTKEEAKEYALKKI